MKGQPHPQLFVIKTRRLNDERREALLAHLAASNAFDPAEAQFSFGDTVALEVAMPRRLVDALGGAPTHDVHSQSDPRNLASPSAQRAVTFDSTMLRNVSPVVAHHNGAAMGGHEADHHTSARSCQWLHRMMDDVYAHRQKQFHFERLAEHQPINGPVPRRFKTPPSKQPQTGRHRSPAASSTMIAKPLASDDLSVSTFQYLSKKFGVPAMVKQHASELLDAVRTYRSQDLEVQLFGLLLMSQAYDTLDIHKTMQWRDALLPFALLKQEATSDTNSTAVTRRFVRVRDIPGLFRKCLVDRSANSKEDVCAHEPLWHRVRCALVTWCDPMGRFPAVVADPNFYCPPFRPTNPYVGRLPISTSSSSGEAPLRHTLLAYEGRFHSFPEHQVVALGQLLMVLLLSWKEERMHPLPSDVCAKSPQRHTSPSTRATPRRTAPQPAAAPSRTPSRTAAAGPTPSSRGTVRSGDTLKAAAGHRTQHAPQPVPNNEPPQPHGIVVSPVERSHPRPHNHNDPLLPQHADPQPEVHNSPDKRTSQGVGGPLAMVDVSPNFNPFASPPPASGGQPYASPGRRRSNVRSVAHLFGSPSLRDEEEQFQRDLHALELRLARSVRGRPQEQRSPDTKLTTV